MQRRTFIQTLSALIATPALPASAPMAAPATHITQHFAKAKLLARCHDRASPEMFARLMKLDTDTAQGVYRMLKDRSVIANGADGIARALNPLNTHCVPNEAVRARDLAKVTSDLTKRLRDMAKRRLEAQESQEDEPAPDIAIPADAPEDDAPDSQV